MMVRNGIHTLPPVRLSWAQAPGRQHGVVLFIALIVLVAMTLAGIALMRSVDTTNQVAGNLAFQQSAVRSGDVGMETAMTWLANNSSGTSLFNDQFGNGYVSHSTAPSPGQSWSDFWTNSLAANNEVKTMAVDVAGNTASYIIQRLCATQGDPVNIGTGCLTDLSQSNSQGGSKGSGTVSLQGTTQVYYRITTRVAGPKNTVSFVQSIVLM